MHKLLIIFLMTWLKKLKFQIKLFFSLLCTFLPVTLKPPKINTSSLHRHQTIDKCHSIEFNFQKTFDFLFNDTAVTLWKFVIWKPIKLIYINSTTIASFGRCCTLGYELRDVEQIYFRTWKVRCIVTETKFLTNLKRKRRVVSVIIRVLRIRKWSFWQHFFSILYTFKGLPKIPFVWESKQ